MHLVSSKAKMAMRLDVEGTMIRVTIMSVVTVVHHNLSNLQPSSLSFLVSFIEPDITLGRGRLVANHSKMASPPCLRRSTRISQSPTITASSSSQAKPRNHPSQKSRQSALRKAKNAPSRRVYLRINKSLLNQLPPVMRA